MLLLARGTVDIIKHIVMQTQWFNTNLFLKENNSTQELIFKSFHRNSEINDTTQSRDLSVITNTHTR